MPRDFIVGALLLVVIKKSWKSITNIEKKKVFYGLITIGT